MHAAQQVNITANQQSCSFPLCCRLLEGLCKPVRATESLKLAMPVNMGQNIGVQSRLLAMSAVPADQIIKKHKEVIPGDAYPHPSGVSILCNARCHCHKSCYCIAHFAGDHRQLSLNVDITFSRLAVEACTVLLGAVLKARQAL